MAEALDETLRRLARERDEADRRYNEALTALDRAQPPAGGFPSPPPGVDDSQLGALNHDWAIIPGPPPSTGVWRGRLSGFIWRTIAPYFERQLTFNSRVVDHLNRQVAAARDAHRQAEETTAILRERSAQLAEFHATLMRYLQQITAYVDTRDRDVTGSAMVVNASLSGLAENMDKRWESLTVRDERTATHMARLAADHEQLRTLVAVSQQATLALKRDLEQGHTVVNPASDPGPERPSDPGSGRASNAQPGAFRSLDSYKYVGFEDQFRGSRDAIRARLQS
jgi:prefoldin subunit 5